MSRSGTIATHVARRHAGPSEAHVAERNDYSTIFSESLSSDAGIAWRLGRLVEDLHPGKCVLDGVQGPFELSEFVAEGKCEARLVTGVHAHMRTEWTRALGLQVAPVNAVYDVKWDGHALRVVVAEWRVGFDRVKQSIV